MALYPQDVIAREVVEQELRADISDSPIAKVGVASGTMTISQAVEENMRTYFASFGEALPPSGLYDRVLTEMEYPLILAALTATRGNQIKAADCSVSIETRCVRKFGNSASRSIAVPARLDIPQGSVAISPHCVAQKPRDVAICCLVPVAWFET